MKKIIIVFIFLALIIGFGVLSHLLAPILTTYTSEFSYEKFNNIKNGTPQEDVRKILGKPFAEANFDKTKGIACDWYSKTNNDWSDIFGWISVRVCYDQTERVSGKGQDIFVN